MFRTSSTVSIVSSDPFCLFGSIGSISVATTSKALFALTAINDTNLMFSPNRDTRAHASVDLAFGALALDPATAPVYVGYFGAKEMYGAEQTQDAILDALTPPVIYNRKHPI
jgi:hypothetical protein